VGVVGKSLAGEVEDRGMNFVNGRWGVGLLVQSGVAPEWVFKGTTSAPLNSLSADVLRERHSVFHVL
jgi:hypothetical protein